MNSETSELRTLDFAVIGAQKCATSWMYYCLKDHPQICLPQKKREVAYIGGKMFREEGEAWFFDRFDCQSGQIRGDVSVDYLYDGSSAEALRRYLPSPRLIVSLRDPIERFISSYYWLCRNSVLPNWPIDRWVSQLPEQVDDWEDALGGDAAQVILRSFYARQLEAFLRVFPAESFLLVLYEDIQAEPLAAIQGIYRYLQVDPAFSPPNLHAQPKKNSYNPMLLFLERTFRSRITSHLVNVAHQGLSRLKRKQAPINKASRRKLAALFAGPTQDFLELLHRFPAAQRPEPEHVLSRWKLN